jgi:hypothetical protein
MTTPLDEQTGSTPAGPGLGDRLAPALAGEPPIGDAVDEIFRRAERLRRRRARVVLAAGVAVAALTALTGYALTTLSIPAAPAHTAASAAPPRPDRIRELLTATVRASGLSVVPREPARGAGWRQYLVLGADGRPHGLIEASAYTAPEGLCFPVRADKTACARPMIGPANVQYVRYVEDQDPDWQVIEIVARHLAGGRTVVVQATGERGTGSRSAGRPPLSPLVAARVAIDPRLAAAFDPEENCTGDAACPVLRVPVTIGK